MFGSCVVTIAFQSAFYLEMHQNNLIFFKALLKHKNK